MQPLKELDPWAAPLDKMGLLGCPFSGVKGNRGAAKSLLPWGKQQESCGISRGYDIPHGLGQRRRCAARPHLREGLLEEKEGAAVGQST